MNKNIKFLLIGSFSFDKLDNGGQPAKSRELFWALCDEYGGNAVSISETTKWKKHPITTFIKMIVKCVKSDIIIMLPAHNGVKVISKILYIIKKLFHKKIYYDVIGGWLNEVLKKNTKIVKYLKSFDCVFVETTTMKNGLDSLNIPCTVVPNFKNLKPITLKDGFDKIVPPYKFCIFSRITEMKGIEEAINAIQSINSLKIRCCLDIFGPIDENYQKRFNELQEAFPPYVSYKGSVSASESVNVLSNYFVLLFPTKFYTEGVPGTIVDAYFSGVPVVSSRWLSYPDVVKEGKTGLGFAFGDFKEFERILLHLIDNPSIVIKMKEECLKESKRYTPSFAMSIFKKEFSK